MEISNLVTRRVSGITFSRYSQGQKTGKPSFGSKKNKRPKQDSQNL